MGLMEQGTLTGQRALERIAKELGHLHPVAAIRAVWNS